jgi:hypothetical protein
LCATSASSVSDRYPHKGIDIFLSHDWPSGIAHHGDVPQLLRAKAFLREEIHDGSLGSPAAAELLATLQPDYWFSAHLHVYDASAQSVGETATSCFPCYSWNSFFFFITFASGQVPRAVPPS